MRKRYLIAIFLLFSLLFTFTSCKKKDEGTKDITVQYCELGLVLSEGFESYDSGGAFDVAYYDGNAIVGMTRYSFVDCIEYGFLSTLDPEKFAEVHLQKTEKEGVEIFKDGDVPYYSYTLTNSSGGEYFYLLAFYRTPYAYFVVTFITPAERSDEMKDVFLQYAKSAYIDGEYM